MHDAVVAVRPLIQVNVPDQGFEIKAQNGHALGTLILTPNGVAFRRPNVSTTKEPRSGITWAQLRKLAGADPDTVRALVDLAT